MVTDDNSNPPALVNSNDAIQCADACDLLWGVAAISRPIGRNLRQTHHMLTTRAIQSARKVGGRWVVSRRALLREFGCIES